MMASVSALAAEWSSTAAAVGIRSDYDFSVGERRTSGNKCLLRISGAFYFRSNPTELRQEISLTFGTLLLFMQNLFVTYLPHVMWVLRGYLGCSSDDADCVCHGVRPPPSVHNYHMGNFLFLCLRFDTK